MRKVLLLVLISVFLAGLTLGSEEIPNWPSPKTWTPARSDGLHTLANITSPLPFIGVTPCRVADTRGNGFTGAYGPPSLVANTTRSFTITGQCGIPAAAAAVSFNFGALNVGGGGDLRVFPASGSVPLVSTLNYNANTPNIANAAIVPLGTGGAITFEADAVSIDLIIDVNGYYAPAATGSFNTFLGRNAGNFVMTGDSNTGFGYGALLSNTTGDFNTATGHNALPNNTMGSFNTATGGNALHNNTTGTGNIGIGQAAGFNLTTGSNNICIGNNGAAGESDTIRVGSFQMKTFVAGVIGVMTGGTGTPVLIDANGQLGTISSSARFKDEIQDMGESTEGLMKLRPVTFRYKEQPEGRTQFGLIGEEVEKVMPELVVCSSSGEVETVLYHEMPSMLLNELQKQQRQIEELKLELAALREIILQAERK